MFFCIGFCNEKGQFINMELITVVSWVSFGNAGKGLPYQEGQGKKGRLMKTLGYLTSGCCEP